MSFELYFLNKCFGRLSFLLQNDQLKKRAVLVSKKIWNIKKAVNVNYIEEMKRWTIFGRIRDLIPLCKRDNMV